ncbi:MAG: transcription antitermination factor NusB [Clostridia bacterium]|nr:transcription antitermination factor NusB [Clostridia bacterium]
MRKDAREAVYKLLFSNQFNDKFDDDFKNYIYLDCNLSKEDITFADELIDNFYKNEEEINQLIAELSKGYKLDRIFVTDKCAMQIAICEITYLKNIPIIVSISEAMELVRKYSTPESPNFVNGILAEYKKRVEEKK